MYRCQGTQCPRLWAFGSQAAYAVYLIHPPIVLLTTRSYYALAGAALRSSGTNYGLFSFTNQPPASDYLLYLYPQASGFPSPTIPASFYYLVAPSPGVAELVDWLGLLYCCTVANLVVWPLAWCLKKLPGVRDVL